MLVKENTGYVTYGNCTVFTTVLFCSETIPQQDICLYIEDMDSGRKNKTTTRLHLHGLLLQA